MVYRCSKQHSELGGNPHNTRGVKVDEITLTPLELIDRIASLVPPPRTHRHRYFGVLAPNSQLRAVAQRCNRSTQCRCRCGCGCGPSQPASTGVGVGVGEFGVGNAFPAQAVPTQPVPPRRAAHYLWAALIARICEVFTLLCPVCGGQMRIIAFITHSADICQILDHIGVEAEPPRIAPVRGPPLWDGGDAPGEGVEPVPAWDEGCQAAPDFEVDQRISW